MDGDGVEEWKSVNADVATLCRGLLVEEGVTRQTATAAAHFEHSSVAARIISRLSSGYRRGVRRMC